MEKAQSAACGMKADDETGQKERINARKWRKDESGEYQTSRAANIKKEQASEKTKKKHERYQLMAALTCCMQQGR